jgi:hypothetical protein
MYRISICVDNHEIVGRQDRELDRDLFERIITGQHPQGDGDAHSRDGQFHGGQNRTCYYHSIWNAVTQSWTESADASQVDQLMIDCAQDKFSG